MSTSTVGLSLNGRGNYNNLSLRDYKNIVATFAHDFSTPSLLEGDQAQVASTKELSDISISGDGKFCSKLNMGMHGSIHDASDRLVI